MRRIITALSIACLFSLGALAQGRKPPPPLPDPNVPKDSLPYKKYPTLPAFNILLRDSVTVFNTYNIPSGRPIGLMLFSPDCHHCHDITKLLVAGMDSLKDIRFVMVSTSGNMQAVRKFYDEFNIGQYKNIEAVGWDFDFFFLSYYAAMRIPDIVLYDADKKLIKMIEASFTVRDIYEAVYGRK